MLASAKKNIVLASISAAILCSVTGATIMHSNNSDMRIINEEASSYIEKHTEESYFDTIEALTEITTYASESSANDIIVYVSSSGKYHANPDCSGMKHFTEMLLDDAAEAGHAPCKRCFYISYDESSETHYEDDVHTDIPEDHDVIFEAPEDTVYVSTTGKYHTRPDCSGMKHYIEMSLTTATEDGYEACKKCTAQPE